LGDGVFQKSCPCRLPQFSKLTKNRWQFAGGCKNRPKRPKLREPRPSQSRRARRQILQITWVTTLSIIQWQFNYSADLLIKAVKILRPLDSALAAVVSVLRYLCRYTRKYKNFTLIPTTECGEPTGGAIFAHL
jgi:hypothetical protein